MKIKLSILLLSICLSFSAAFAQSPTSGNNQEDPVKPETAPKSDTVQKVTITTKFAAKDYEDMLKKLKAGDVTVNFAAMRMAYTETKDYAPYGGSEARNKMFTFYDGDESAKAVKAAEDILETNYVDIAAQFIAWRANEKLENSEKAAFHKKVFDGLMNAIFENDGLTAKTGILSIGISEQYLIMSFKGFSSGSKALLKEEGSMFDVHTAVDPDTKETRKFYFNINKVFGRF